jgi:ribosomal protein S18 acetylase RimI-like enzyme
MNLAVQLPRIETYYDGVPRSVARVERIGPFSLFVNPGPGWPYYARPSLGAANFSIDDVQRVRARQRELGAPESFEWVAEVTPALADVVNASGVPVGEHPLMLLDATQPAAVADRSDDLQVRLATLDDDLALLNAIAQVGFNNPGSAVGVLDLDAARKVANRDPAELAFRQARLRRGQSIMAVAFVGDQPVGVGSHNPLESVTEIVGVAVLPALRRRGAATALTRLLVADALQRGVQTVFLSANDAGAARIYERIGFQTIATACTAEPNPV